MSFTPPTPSFIELHRPDAQALRDELAAGLLAAPAQIAPKFFYDALGSRLFGAITELPEYYPTRTEAAIFAQHAAEMAQAICPGATLIDLGAGDCEKAAGLFSALRPARYVAVDISVDFLRGALASLQQRFPALPMLGVGLDFSHSLALPEPALAGRPLFFYPGSSIGNFTPDAALRFLRHIREKCDGGGLLIGVDLVKPANVLEPAYDDALGVTAAFNLNALLHVNRLIGGDFALRQWKHVALFNAADSRIEMHLEAREPLCVRWSGGQREFAAGERIHTEDSYKYTPQAFTALLRDAGFTQVQAWLDERRWFAQFWARG
ncbi:MAG TPA: L-histidine N(alpha)-methyltransferase [Albitalea sp.]|nr:L-histidine N(alpha)-methyltransferase [Albitalea sp.]